MSNRFSNSVVFISGGGGGIGAAAARRFAAEGATVIVGDLRTPAEVPAGVDFREFDVTREDQWRNTLDSIVDRYGRLDVLVNAAGIVGDVIEGTLDRMTLDEWRRVMAVNLDGTFLGCREAVRVMSPAARGAIVNLSSVGSYYPTTQSVAYGASKGAVTRLTKTVALFGSQDGKKIRCNSVHPGRTDTPMLDSIVVGRKQREGSDPTSQAALAAAARIPLGPNGTPDDVADLIAFLSSGEAKYITGAEFVVDGGWKLLR